MELGKSKVGHWLQEFEVGVSVTAEVLPFSVSASSLRQRWRSQLHFLIFKAC